MDTSNRYQTKLVRSSVTALLVLLLSGFQAMGLASPAEDEQESALGLQGHSSPLDDQRLDALRGQGLQASRVASPNIGVILWDEGGQGGRGGQTQSNHGGMNLKIHARDVQ